MEKGNKNLIITIIIIIVLVLGLGGYVIYDKVFSKDNISDENKTDQNKTDQNNDESLADKYTNLISIDDEYSNGVRDNKIYLINTKTKEEIISEDYYDYNKSDSIENGFDQINLYRELNEIKLYISSHCPVLSEDFKYKLYSNNKKVILDLTSEDNIQGSIYQDYIYVTNINDVKKYDMNGNLVSTIKFDNEVKDVILDKAIFVDNNTLTIKDINTKEVIKSTSISEGFKYYSGEYIGNNENYHLTNYNNVCRVGNYTDSVNGIHLMVTGISDSKGNGAYIYILNESNQLKTVEKQAGSQCF